MGYDLILGWDWLQAFDPLISFRTGSFVWNKKLKEEEGTLSRENMDWFVAAIEDGSVGIVMGDGQVLGRTCQPGETPPSYVESELGKSMRILWDSYAARTNWDKDPTSTPLPDDKLWYVGAIAQYESMKTTKSVKASPADLPQAYQEYADVFSEEGAATLARHGVQDHAIDLEPYTMPPQLGLYNLSQRELQVLREYLDAALKKS